MRISRGVRAAMVAVFAAGNVCRFAPLAIEFADAGA
jgi:hypothetical protein